MPKVFSLRFEVIGSGAFPVDMLRYDQCYPASEVDSALMQPHERGQRAINLVTVRPYYDRGEPCRLAENGGFITVDRWHSFNWEVGDVGDPEKL